MANEKLQHDTGNIVNDIVPAMWSLYYALRSRGLEKTIKVTTPQHPGFLRTPVPPSRAEAVEAFKPHWAKLLDFITKTGQDASPVPAPSFPPIGPSPLASCVLVLVVKQHGLRCAAQPVVCSTTFVRESVAGFLSRA